jgi:hypothetical protein
MNFLLGGRLGDLVHALYVANNTPGVHDLYVTDRRELHSDGFVLSLEETFKELEPILIDQPWCHSFQIYADQFPVPDGDLSNLSMWRRYAYSASWTQLLANTFGVPAVGGPWIWMIDQPKKEEWAERIVFHCSIQPARRGHWNIPIEKYGDERAIFVGNEQEFAAFGYKMDFYHPKDLCEHFQIINSAKFFIGNQSAPLAMAHSMDVPRLAILSKSDEIHYIGEEKFSKNFFYIAEDKMFYEGINY